ncbi:MAG TPA: DUF1501 domain-containing protein [Anaerolineae bacterium]|nr:DUF1501 domain-containing protein [Anaerolineae bacterium]
MPPLSRRQFLQGCSTAIAAMSGARLHSAVFANPEAEPNQDILITVFLRGGADVLNIIPPIGGADRGHYETARQAIQVPIADALALGTSAFGLHPAMQGLHDLYTAGHLAIVQATGMPNTNTRSHFEAMAFMEHGTPGDNSTASGWIARHLESATNLPTNIIMPAAAIGNNAPASFATNNEVIAMNSVSNFGLTTGFSRWRDAQRVALRHLYSGMGPVYASGLQALNASDIITLGTAGGYTPLPGVTYPANSFGGHMQTIAQMIKLQVGLRMVTVDLGGWDTHDRQGDGAGGYFAGLLATLSDGLRALFDDLNTSERANYIDRVTVVVMSEFGRRVRENADDGTDHGHGGAMFVLGGQVNGGPATARGRSTTDLYGTWPGLANAQLYDNADLAITTDYRQVLSELLIRRLGNPHLGYVFPGYTNYTPLGLVQGTDLAPDYGNVPTAIDLQTTGTTTPALGTKVATVAGVGLAATAGLVALRNRGSDQ